MDGTQLANGGDHPALNFLNTRSRPWGEQIELLATGATFLDWLVSADLIDDTQRSELTDRFAVAELDQAAADARELREWLRGEICTWSQAEHSAEGLSAAEVTRLNRILATDDRYTRIVASPGGGLELHVQRHWNDARQLLVLLAEAAAELFAHGERDLVRTCHADGCDIYFYDRTKSHRRRWCSQAVCGNRDKVKNHRARARATVVAR